MEDVIRGRSRAVALQRDDVRRRDRIQTDGESRGIADNRGEGIGGGWLKTEEKGEEWTATGLASTETDVARRDWAEGHTALGRGHAAADGYSGSFGSEEEKKTTGKKNRGGGCWAAAERKERDGRRLLLRTGRRRERMGRRLLRTGRRRERIRRRLLRTGRRRERMGVAAHGRKKKREKKRKEKGKK